MYDNIKFEYQNIDKIVNLHVQRFNRRQTKKLKNDIELPYIVPTQYTYIMYKSIRLEYCRPLINFIELNGFYNFIGAIIKQFY